MYNDEYEFYREKSQIDHPNIASRGNSRCPVYKGKFPVFSFYLGQGVRVSGIGSFSVLFLGLVFVETDARGLEADFHGSQKVQYSGSGDCIVFLSAGCSFLFRRGSRVLPFFQH